jgi:hypothetical protein
VDLQAVFPIDDAASARFMHYKALCLLRAGVISREQKRAVDDAVADALMIAFDARAPVLLASARHPEPLRGTEPDRTTTVTNPCAHAA